jgi:hypothetical protein
MIAVRRPLDSLRVLGLALVVLLVAASAGRAGSSATVARCGKGWLEVIDGQKVLHLEGTPYEMGYQHGALMKDDIRELVRFLFDVKAKQFTEQMAVDLGPLGALKPDAKQVIGLIAGIQKTHVPDRFHEEMRGVADGSGMAYEEIVRANFIPELFHCSGFALAGSATKGGTLYHGRVLDYGCDWHLQDHAVLVIAKPEGRIPFANVTYAGFVGSVTGMNAEAVGVGEMGGRGMGKWDGTPMAILMRMVLEDAHNLEEGLAIFRDRPRTCQYYYVLSDGKAGKAVGLEGSYNAFQVIGMGEAHPLLPEPVADAVVMSAGERYHELARRVKAGHGTFDAESARHLMDRPVAMKSNLHNVLMEPASGDLWVAHASADARPAADQPYHAFNLHTLLGACADSGVPALPCPVQPVAAGLATEAAAGGQ